MLYIIFGTFVSEDLAAIAAGVSARNAEISLQAACLAAALGIFLGDLILWLVGYTVARFAAGSKFSKWLNAQPAFEKFERKSKTHWVQLLFASRFVPGLRLPVYLAAGFFKTPFLKTLALFAVASVVWAPILVIASYAGHAWLSQTLNAWLTNGFVLTLFSVVTFFIAVKLVNIALRSFSRFEFWPSWLTYLPLVPYILWLAVKNKSFMAPTVSNPFIPFSGMVGESKSAILKKLPGQWTLDHDLIDESSLELRIAKVRLLFENHKYKFPVVLKPDAGQRGAGVKLCHSMNEVCEHLAKNPEAQIMQACHPGPREIGIFYVRYPNQPQGQIFSITDKVFPVLKGDGKRTVGELVQAHERYVLQAQVFKKRHAKVWNQVIPANEEFRLCFAGNHCQGTLFQDGCHFITKRLESTIDSIAKQVEGFYFGRFDIRFECDDELMQGRNFSILELNGATSESTNIYDPSWNAFKSYKVLFSQWKCLFEIGRENIERGHKPPSLFELCQSIFKFYSNRRGELISD